MISLNYQMVLITRYSRLYGVHYKKHKTLPANLPIHIYINRVNNRSVFEIKGGYRLQL